MSNQIQYIITPQRYKAPDLAVREGKVIRAKRGWEVIGRTGYVEWNTDEYKAIGVNTAHLMDVGLWPVNISSYLKGTGKKLLETVFEEVALEGFGLLVIDNVLASTQGFYDKSLQRLKYEGKIIGHIRKTHEITDDSDQLLGSYGGINVSEPFFTYEVLISHVSDFRNYWKWFNR